MTEQITFSKTVPVIGHVDVLVVGAGIAGLTAAITAGREGAKTALVDRFGFPGGNLGPGLIQGAPNLELPQPLSERFPGIPGELIRRCEDYTGGQLLNHYFRDSQILITVALEMLQESNVELLFNTTVVEPIMDGHTVSGLIIENKSGTQAVKAAVVIDATGDADVAVKAGAPCDEGRRYFSPGLYFALGNVNTRVYSQLFDQTPSTSDREWAAGLAPPVTKRLHHLEHLLPYFRPAWEHGEYHFVWEVDPGRYLLCDHGIFRSVVGVQYVPNPLADDTYQLVGAMVGVHGANTGPTSGDAALMNRLETTSRRFIFATTEFLKRRVPGFERSYLHMVSPYFHARGGRSIVSEYSLQEEDLEQERSHHDAVFVGHVGLPKSPLGRDVFGYSPEKSFDFPYRQLLPQTIDGLLAAGRSAIIQPPTTRVRWMVLLMGQAAGAAAALAAAQQKPPRGIAVRQLQQILCEKYGVQLQR